MAKQLFIHVYEKFSELRHEYYLERARHKNVGRIIQMMVRFFRRLSPQAIVSRQQKIEKYEREVDVARTIRVRRKARDCIVAYSQMI